MPVKTKTAATDDLVPFAWAGLILNVPPTYRPFKIEGNARKGMICLADDSRSRLELAWGIPRRKRFNADAILRRKLTGTMPRRSRRSRRNTPDHIQTRSLPTFSTLLGYRDEDQELDRWLGFIPTTRRAVEIVYHHGSARENKTFLDHMLPSLADQPPNRPQRWAFFGHRFTTPAGYAYRDSTLNLGDMKLRVTAWERGLSRASVTIRMIYPAELALARMLFDDWLDDHVTHRKRAHRPRYRKLFHRGGIVCKSFDTKLGPALVADADLRRLLKTISWGLPWLMRTWLIHDQKHDRLVLVDAQDKRRRLDPIIDTIVNGMQWT